MKECTKCRRSLPEEQFHRKGDRRQGSCKDCKSQYTKGWYERNKASHKKVCSARGSRIYRENSDWLNQLKTSPCTDCGGVFNPWQMDFDHLENKSFNVSSGRRMSRKRLEVEVAKCELVCANCHRNRTHRRQEPNLRSGL